MPPDDGEPSQPTLTIDELAREAGTSRVYIESLIEAGAVVAAPDGSHDIEDVPRVRLASALADGGFDPDYLMAAIRSGALQLDWVTRLGTGARLTGRTFAEFATSMGDRASQLPAIYAAFGLAVPSPDTLTREDEEQAIVDFIDLWQMVDDQPETYLRAARIAGEGVRRLQGATQDLFDELGGPPNTQSQRGKSPEDAHRPAMRLSPTVSELLVWLQKRHQESEVFGRIVGYVERTIVEQGVAKRPAEAQAIAFVDLSGYTELTVEAGDERAAQFATSLQVLAESAARAHGGRVVKLLGDGVMLRYRSVRDAVDSVRELMAAIGAAGLPAAHAGIAAGPLVIRDGDVYGHTVNLAARIASQAQAGELLVGDDVTARLDEAGIRWEDAGEAHLKGIGDPVRLARVELTTDRELGHGIGQSPGYST
jgi:adenylate cyclase